jgi:hypothetical protein
MATSPRDRFDDLPADLVRVGAHRAPARRGRGWISFAWAALATGVLVVGGLYGLSQVNPAISFQLPSFGAGGDDPEVIETTAPPVEPITDPALVDPELNVSFSILNASPTDGQQVAADLQLQQAGWPADKISRANAAQRDIEVTAIYFNGAQYEGVARGVATILGTDLEYVRNSDAYLGAPITIVLGADYEPPTS